ncbi:MAG: matrixin family metalloprotease [Actinomycetota bacterium]|nr:matrixin family metalloprotease [Actinomycetota bacterium]PLS75812.1 MAG: hypothetical protein CYG61_05440 [Actinomycetota bacterium]
MSAWTRLAEPLRLFNLFLLSMGLFQVVVVNIAPLEAGALGPDHWRSAQRRLVVVDKTGDRGWQQATRHAVDVWNQAAGPTGVRLTWTTGSGTCSPDRVRISVCTASAARLGGGRTANRQGRADVELDPDGHNLGAFVLVCSDCRPSEARRRVIATHEIGHTLGLSHTPRLSSVMLHTGGAERPDDLDAAEVRSLYEHVDGPLRCGVFNLRLGTFCL